MGPITQPLGLYRLNGTGHLYKEAMGELWVSFAATDGNEEGRKLTPVNIRHDTDVRNFVVYTDASIAIRADVIKFQ